MGGAVALHTLMLHLNDWNEKRMESLNCKNYTFYETLGKIFYYQQLHSFHLISKLLSIFDFIL